MYHFFVTPDSVADGKIYIEGTDVNHIRNVLRMRPGDELCVNDGAGVEYLCEIEGLAEDEIVCRIISTGEQIPSRP